MSRSIRKPLVLRAFVLGLAVAGCNTILDNQPGQLRETSTPTDVSPTQPPGNTARVPGVPTGTDASAAPPVQAPPSSGTSGPQCAPGQKVCHGLCVTLTDPLYGCGDPSCTPCSTPHGSAGCENNACKVQACDPGYSDCNGSAADGCEVDLANPATCGGCNGLCPPSAPVCAPAGPGFQCSTGCPAEAPVLCGNQCSALNSVNHCGACDNRCPEVDQATAECAAGQCAFRCRPGYHACGGKCVVATDPSACGPSCTACPVPDNGEATCQADTCGIQCKSGYRACGGRCAAANDPNNCGPTCAPCPAPPNAVATCTGDACAFQCAAGYGDCNGDPADGCEAALGSDPLHCGACGVSCNGGMCNAGTCGGAPPGGDAGAGG